MNSEEKTIVRMRFKAMAAQVNGMAFQNLFTQIMSYAYSNFSPVKPQGNEGDWKNDGHDPSAGRYYQVYAPEVLNEADAVKKIEADFDGLAQRWGDTKVYPNGINEFYFVLNDAYRVTPGAYPTTYAALAKLKIAHSLSECKPFLMKDLEDVLLGLTDDQMMMVVGFIPNPATIRVLRMDLISEVVGHIIANPILRSLKQSLAAPDFEEKIKFNRLNHAAGWLRDADYRRGTVEEFFSRNSQFSRQDVSDKLNAIYQEAKNQGFSDMVDGPTASDQQFEFLLRQATPKPPHGADLRVIRELEEAALVVLAYFFEACDVFEEPNGAAA